ncbi:sugar phosphate isomerase/epimerase family protein [Spirilliplanes yamanashiensis]|uniref:Xylose isomerase n=1 Tax=Spirilliplanes yamanashiensis TaxID=42233 RepID=A0A8J4DHU0_9ACTN|nr:sugar phosphate isomerase/epimerase [Spirilliplanes yamanashiensis]MDP9814788.1 sugar phosphate isomerase/epimerase [Spirilliplanes yamanashiensis]GIJ02442.1 xylose isomerase [Spirilliplanes yamanashiensis]
MFTDHTDGPLSRRALLRSGAVVAAAAGTAGVIATPAEAAPDDRSGSPGRRRVPVDRISIQLYTVRDVLAADPAGTIAALARIGYRRVELAGTAGLTAAAFRALLDANGIRATSGHFSIPQPFDEAAWRATLADARTLGCQYVVHPFFGAGQGGPIRDAAVWRAFAQDLNRAGAMARQAGFRFGYHNHQLEFLPLADGSGRTAFDLLMAVADRRLVHLELDLYWSWRGAADPVDVIRAHCGRVLQFHCKDMNVDSGFADLGTGLIDFRRIFAHSRTAGVQEYIVERDDAGTGDREPEDALDTAAVGYRFLRSIRF